MQWGQIKTLFILCFLILDVFLVYQFMNKREQAQLGLLPDTSIEEQLQTEDIQMDNLPKEIPKKAYISARRYSFTEEDKKSLDEMENQEPDVLNNIVVSKFEEPIPVDLEGERSKIADAVKSSILFGDEYKYWGFNEKHNVFMFFQNYKENPIYYNESGVVFAFLNDEQKAVSSYVQTRLDEISSTGEKQDLIKPIQAVETLYKQNQIYSGDQVSELQAGYYTLVPLQNGVQVFSPTWNIIVNKDRNYFINGLEGQYISKDEDEFIQEAMESFREQTVQLEESIWSGES